MIDREKNDWSHWREIVGKYNRPELRKSLWQIVNSFIPYLGLWILMIYTVHRSYWITLGLSILAAGFLVRIFIIFHDCGHGSFFKSSFANRTVGIFAGLLSFTPYHEWHRSHKIHHQTVGNLDKRGVGDVMTLTVDEYKKLSRREKISYRIYRNPVIMFLIAPLLIFTVITRFPDKNSSPKIKLYTHLTTLSAIVLIFLVSLLIGFRTWLLIQLPVLFFSAVFGVWLFYVQHQYKDVVWERTENWDYTRIAMEGSSFLKLPAILQWFSGNIGFHHIHHLSPMIPNYNLEKCYMENPLFHKNYLSLFSGIKSVKYHLWDEKNRKLVGFKDIADWS